MIKKVLDVKVEVKINADFYLDMLNKKIDLNIIKYLNITNNI